jgi:hypothetical protein
MPVRAARLSLLWCLLGCVPAWGQATDTVYSPKATFNLPFNIKPDMQEQVREVQLYVATEPGRAWQLYRNSGPTLKSFPFAANRDGAYLFFVRTVFNDGRAQPPSVEAAPPELRVIVDTQAPRLTLRPLPPRQDQVGVEWDVRDENLDVSSLTLEWRVVGNDWVRLAIDGQPSGQKYWPTPGRGQVEMRLRAKDLAENANATTVPLGGGQAAPADGRQPNYYDQGGSGSRPAGLPNVRYINSTEMNVNYALEDVGPSGVSSVELYYTHNGRNWQRYGENPRKEPPFAVKLPGEGVYGLTLVVKSGAGLGDRPPAFGDAPQMYVEVDLTKPAVQLLSAEPGRGGDSGTLTVTWNAADRNLAGQPISLLYGEAADGPWAPLAQNLDNTGRYVWRVPGGTPYKFFVRVEAADKAGNIGRADSPKPIIIDLAQPKGRLIGVEVTPTTTGNP